ncbi:unnamed protein product, partial [Medioppia subpectinata]
YGNIGYKIFFYKAPNSSQSLHSRANNKSKVIKMLFAVWILFVLCWSKWVSYCLHRLPMHVFILLLTFRPSIVSNPSPFQYYLFVGSYFIIHWTAMANSCINPFIYCFMSANFRKDFVDLKKLLYRKLFMLTTVNTGISDEL